MVVIISSGRVALVVAVVTVGAVVRIVAAVVLAVATVGVALALRGRHALLSPLSRRHHSPLS